MEFNKEGEGLYEKVSKVDKIQTLDETIPQVPGPSEQAPSASEHIHSESSGYYDMTESDIDITNGQVT